jgi:hypothetical protein
MSENIECEREALFKRYRDIMTPGIGEAVNTTLFRIEIYCRYIKAEDAWALTCLETNRNISMNWRVAYGAVPKAVFQKEAEARTRMMVRKIEDWDRSTFANRNIIADPTQPETSKGTERTPTSYIAENKFTGTCRGLSAKDGERWEAIKDKDLMRMGGSFQNSQDDIDALEKADQRIIQKGEERVRLTKEAKATADRIAAETAAAEAFAAEEARTNFYQGADTFGQF